METEDAFSVIHAPAKEGGGHQAGAGGKAGNRPSPAPSEEAPTLSLDSGLQKCEVSVVLATASATPRRRIHLLSPSLTQPLPFLELWAGAGGDGGSTPLNLHRALSSRGRVSPAAGSTVGSPVRW